MDSFRHAFGISSVCFRHRRQQIRCSSKREACFSGKDGFACRIRRETERLLWKADQGRSALCGHGQLIERSSAGEQALIDAGALAEPAKRFLRSFRVGVALPAAAAQAVAPFVGDKGNHIVDGIAQKQADLFTAAEFDADKAAHYAAIAFGCPSMGAEQLEESEFEPMFEAVKPALAGKKIALFGSYGWGGGLTKKVKKYA